MNTYFVQLEQLTGLCAPFTLANEMGMNLDPNNYEVVSFTLGVADESPVAMASAYATFAARGVYCAPSPVTQILDRDGKPIPLQQPGCHRVLRPAVADGVNAVLQGVMKPGGTGAALNINQPTAGKTGTTDDSQSVWFIGYTPNMAGQRCRGRLANPAAAHADRRDDPRDHHRVRLRWRHRRTDLAAGDAGHRALPA